jgi:hypothetical protein
MATRDRLKIEDQRQKVPPEVTMASMIQDDLGIKVDADLLRDWIWLRWGRLSPLAHKIHANERKR